jgi:hypothetical protein
LIDWEKWTDYDLKLTAAEGYNQFSFRLQERAMRSLIMIYLLLVMTLLAGCGGGDSSTTTTQSTDSGDGGGATLPLTRVDAGPSGRVDLRVSWDLTPTTQLPVTGFKVYHAATPDYDAMLPVGEQSDGSSRQFILRDVAVGTHYFAVTVDDIDGYTSAYSDMLAVEVQ